MEVQLLCVPTFFFKNYARVVQAGYAKGTSDADHIAGCWLLQLSSSQDRISSLTLFPIHTGYGGKIWLGLKN